MKQLFRTLLIIILGSLLACEKETDNLNFDENQSKSPFTIRIIGQEEINSNLHLKKELNKFNKKKSNTLNRDVYNAEYYFTVNTDNVKYVEAEDGSVHSYTFSINAIEGSDYVDNLVITSQTDGSYKSEILAYKFINDNQIEINSVDLEDFDASIYLSRFTFSYTCTTTINYTTVFDDDCTCEYIQVHSVDTSCNYTYIDAGDGSSGGGGSGNSWTDGIVYSGGGGASGGAGNSGNNNTQTVTSPNVHLGNWLKESLSIGNLNATPDEITICNWIDNNYATINPDRSNPFFNVYYFYIENISVSNIDEIVKEIMLIMNADPGLTFEKALEEYVLNNNLSFAETPDIVITDMADFLECFDPTKSAKLTIYVREPDPGTGETWEATLGGVVVGHTFVSISQGVNTAVYGYYPASNDVTPNSPSDTAAMGNDTKEGFSASISSNITAIQLQQIIDHSINFNNTYNLNTNNCTDFAIDIGNLGGLSLPGCEDSWPGGSGSNPGTLGLHIKNMSTSIGITKNTNGGKAPPTFKGC